MVIEHRRSVILQDLMYLIGSLLRIPCVNAGPKCPRSLCYHLSVNDALKAVGLGHNKKETIADIMEKMEKFILPKMNASERSCEIQTHCEAIHPRKAAADLAMTLGSIRARATGLCLDCVRADRWDGKSHVDCRKHTSILARPC